MKQRPQPFRTSQTMVPKEGRKKPPSVKTTKQPKKAMKGRKKPHSVKTTKRLQKAEAMKAMKDFKTTMKEAKKATAMGNGAAMSNRAAMGDRAAIREGKMQFANHPFAKWVGYAQVNCGGAMNWLFVKLPQRKSSTVLWAGYNQHQYKLVVTHDNPWPQWQLVPEQKKGTVKQTKGAIVKAKKMKGAVMKEKKGAK